jgi:hypothetical protein
MGIQIVVDFTVFLWYFSPNQTLSKGRSIMKKIRMAIICALVICTWEASSYAADINGNWCRNVNGALADVITIAGQGAMNSVELREGWTQPVYSAGVGTVFGNAIVATLKSKTSSVVVHAVMKQSGNDLSYDSYNLDGSFRWKGSYYRCSR